MTNRSNPPTGPAARPSAPSTHPAAVADRAAGVLLGHAVGDALGVPYEFATPPTGDAVMSGGGLGDYEPGEWSDDTQMSACVFTVVAAGARLDEPSGLDAVAENFRAWYRAGPPDIGMQTSAVLGAADRAAGTGKLRAATLARVAAEYAAAHPHSAGNGALMRSESVALAHLHRRDTAARAAAAVASLTHADPLAVESCVLATETIRVAVLTGQLDFCAGLDLLDVDRRDLWRAFLDDAHTRPPSTFSPNGFTVTALQAAVAAVVSTPVPDLDPGTGSYPCQHLQHALHAAVRIGDDTDTVAAIAGAFLGARWGASAVPWRMRRDVHGKPGAPSGRDLRARDLVGAADRIVAGGRGDSVGWPDGDRVAYGEPRTAAVPHPRDPGVWLGTSNCDAPGTDAVVSLCRVGKDEPDHAGAAGTDRVEVRLIDTDDPDANPNLGFVLADAADAVAGLREEGRTVLLHCVAAQQRTPSVAVAYARRLGAAPEAAEAEIRAALASSIRGRGLVWDTART